MEQMWVRKSYGGYRKAMRYVAKEFHGVQNLSALDADHIAARTILKDFSDAWIAVFPTYKGSNRGFGYIERKIPKVQKGFESISLSPLATFKILNGRMSRSIDDLDRALADIKGQISTGRNNYLQDFVCSIRDHISKHIQDR